MSNAQAGIPPVVMSVTAFDPSGGAGVIADLNTLAAHNCYGVAAITALICPNGDGKPKFQHVGSAWLKDSIQSLLSRSTVAAIKIGMLPSRASAEIVQEIIGANPAFAVVVDPNLSGNGGQDGKDVINPAVFRELLLARATVVTASMAEAAALTGLKVDSVEGMKAAVAKIVEMGARSAVISGDQLEKPLDIYCERGSSETFAGERLKTEIPAGTRCTFSSAVAANLALGRQPHDAVMLAKAYVIEALRKAFSTGSGPARLNHFYRLHQGPRLTDITSAASEAAHQ